MIEREARQTGHVIRFLEGKDKPGIFTVDLDRVFIFQEVGDGIFMYGAHPLPLMVTPKEEDAYATTKAYIANLRAVGRA